MHTKLIGFNQQKTHHIRSHVKTEERGRILKSYSAFGDYILWIRNLDNYDTRKIRLSEFGVI